MILSAQTIRAANIISVFHERSVYRGMSFGLGPAGYDVRIAQEIIIPPSGCVLASTVEYFDMPGDVIGKVCDKSTWARRFLSVMNTTIDPGWRGYLTLELVNHSAQTIHIYEGSPIAKIQFMKMDKIAEFGYAGKYQDQPSGPVEAQLELGVFTRHIQERQGDEMACSCGKRWDVGEMHP